jgi:glycine/D-amino acid oxidase-like deaminating enzyme
MVSAPTRAPLTADLDIEVCVVGAGLAGLTVAREIARRGFPVAVIEAWRIAWNASGRNTGFVLPGFAQSMETVTRRAGLAQAKALWALSEMGLEYVRKTIDETGMPGAELTEGGWLKVSKTGEIEDDLAEVRLIGQEFGAPIEGWPVERVREVLKSRSYFHAVHFPQAFAIHPLNYALGLAAAAEAEGARIFEDTPAIEIDPDGVRKRVVTPSGLVRAYHLVLAGNVHLGAVMPKVSGTLMPISIYVVTTAPLGARLAEAISYRGTVSDTERADNHYRIVGGDRLMWSGGMSTSPRDPRRYVRKLQADIARTYPQLGEVAIEHAWTGTLGNSLHRMPQLGELAPNVWLASGFGGHGLNTTAMAGNIVARGIVENDDTWRRFLPFELIWAGGRAGRAAAQVNYWWYHAREVYAARKAREREDAQHPTQGEASPGAVARVAGAAEAMIGSAIAQDIAAAPTIDSAIEPAFASASDSAPTERPENRLRDVDAPTAALIIPDNLTPTDIIEFLAGSRDSDRPHVTSPTQHEANIQRIVSEGAEVPETSEPQTLSLPAFGELDGGEVVPEKAAPVPIKPPPPTHPEPPPPSAVDRALDALSQFGRAVTKSREPPPSGGRS